MPRSLVRPVPLALMREYGPEVGRMVAALGRLHELANCLIVGVRSAQFRLRPEEHIRWNYDVHIGGHGRDRFLRLDDALDASRFTLACPGAWRERERLRRRPAGLPCSVSREDGLVILMRPGEHHIYFDTAKVLEDGVVEMTTKKGARLRAYRIVERPRHVAIEDLHQEPERLVLRPSDLPPVPEALVSHYLATELRVADEHRRTWALQPAAEPAPESLAWPFPREAHVLSAWNPLSVPLSAAENRLRQGRLIRQLARRGVRYWGGVGTQPDAGPGAWVEESLLAADLTREEAVTLGRSFHQHAVFELHGSLLRLVGCRDGRILGERAVRAQTVP